MGKVTVDFCLQCQEFLPAGTAEEHLNSNHGHHLVEAYVDEDYYNEVVASGIQPTKTHLKDESGEVYSVEIAENKLILTDHEDNSVVVSRPVPINLIFPGYGVYSYQTTYSTVATFLFPGTDNSSDYEHIQAVAGKYYKQGEGGSIRLYNLSTHEEIAVAKVPSDLMLSTSTTEKNLIDFKMLKDLPEEPSFLELQIRCNEVSSGVSYYYGMVRCSSVHMY